MGTCRPRVVPPPFDRVNAAGRSGHVAGAARPCRPVAAATQPPDGTHARGGVHADKGRLSHHGSHAQCQSTGSHNGSRPRRHSMAAPPPSVLAAQSVAITAATGEVAAPSTRTPAGTRPTGRRRGGGTVGCASGGGQRRCGCGRPWRRRQRGRRRLPAAVPATAWADGIGWGWPRAAVPPIAAGVAAIHRGGCPRRGGRPLVGDDDGAHGHRRCRHGR